MTWSKLRRTAGATGVAAVLLTTFGAVADERAPEPLEDPFVGVPIDGETLHFDMESVRWVLFEGQMITSEEFWELGLPAPSGLATPATMEAGYIMQFRTLDEAEAFEAKHGR